MEIASTGYILFLRTGTFLGHTARRSRLGLMKNDVMVTTRIMGEIG